ncbi:MAG: hypothetical protein ACJ72E_12050 [Marmoricola sp.]
METQHRPPAARVSLVDDTGIRFAIGTGLVVLTLFVAGLAGLGAGPTACAAVVVAGLASGRLPLWLAGTLGAITWAFFTGFDENTFGQLTFAHGDLERLAGFAAATVLIAIAARELLADHRRSTRG